MRRTFTILGWAAVLVCSLAVCAQAAALWRATRIDDLTFTRYYDAQRAEREAQDQGGSLADLFAETGLEEHTGAVESIPNRFMLGLLPGGSGKYAISVLTLAGPAGLSAVIALVGLAGALRRSSPSEGRAGGTARTP